MLKVCFRQMEEQEEVMHRINKFTELVPFKSKWATQRIFTDQVAATARFRRENAMVHMGRWL